jgi:hypothetical protein
VKTEVELASKTLSFVQNFIQWTKSKKKEMVLLCFFNIWMTCITVLSNMKWKFMHTCCSSECAIFWRSGSHRRYSTRSDFRRHYFIVTHTITSKIVPNDPSDSALSACSGWFMYQLQQFQLLTSPEMLQSHLVLDVYRFMLIHVLLWTQTGVLNASFLWHFCHRKCVVVICYDQRSTENMIVLSS